MNRALLVLASAILGACGSTTTSKAPSTGAAIDGAPATIRASKSDDGTTIEARVGDRILLTLEENLSTGFRWDVVTLPDEAVLAIEARNATPNNGAPSGAPIAGSPGTHDYTLRAVAVGVTTLKLDYKRPWETKPPVATFTLTVHVSR